MNLMNNYEREYKISSSILSSSKYKISTAILSNDRQSNQSKTVISRIVISLFNSSNTLLLIALISRHLTSIMSSSMSSSIDDARRSLKLLKRKLLDKKWVLFASISDTRHSASSQFSYYHHRHLLSEFYYRRNITMK